MYVPPAQLRGEGHGWVMSQVPPSVIILMLWGFYGTYQRGVGESVVPGKCI